MRHPGEVGLYKYQWNGLKIDTMEFIYPLLSHKNEELNIEFIKTKKPVYKPNTKDGVLLKEVPKEYLSVTDYEWFEMFKK
ncbi:hypothetical protein AD998_11280 [bacterium 336/3]|nr:hypothetical protein AD998_11280 [bacterium 336/3]